MTSPARGGPDTAGVDPAEIVRQRELGWPDFHPEDYCHSCGRPNPTWFADTAEWQTATGSTGDGGGILCPSCFCALWEQQTGKAAIIWRLSIDPRSRDAHGPDTAGMRDRLAEALRDELVRLDEWPTGLELADALLPVVQRLAVEKAAEELRAAAQWLREASLSDVPGPPAVWQHLDAIAPALAAERAKAREPFLALAEELERHADLQRHSLGGPTEVVLRWQSFHDAAANIRRAAEEIA